MRKHLQYAGYILRHKYFVFVAGLKVRAPLFRLLVHDWTKILPCEWCPYTEYFYGRRKWLRENEPDDYRYWAEAEPYIAAFNRAWLHHIHWNKHHWNHWVLTNDDGSQPCLPMPDKYVREMVADWMGAGRAITGEWTVLQWYADNYDKIKLHPKTRQRVEELLIPIRKEAAA